MPTESAREQEGEQCPVPPGEFGAKLGADYLRIDKQQL